MPELALAALAALALLVVLGAPLALALNLRGLWAAALTPVFALTVVSVTAFTLPYVGIAWSLVPVFVVALIATLVLLGVRWLATRRSAPMPKAHAVSGWWAVAALAVATVVITAQILLIVGEPQNFSQTYDNIFHLNAVRYVMNEQNASPYFVSTMTNYTDAVVFYPSGWHAFVSLVCMITGASIPITINAVTIVVCAGIWPISMLLFTRAFFGASPALTVTTAIASTAAPAFPLLLLDYGVLYPLQLGFAMLPATLAAAANLFGLCPQTTVPPLTLRIFAVLGCLPALAIVHPGAFVGWLVLTGPLVLVATVAFVARTRSVAKIAASVAAFGIYLLVLFRLITVLRPPEEARTWMPDRRIREAAWNILTVDFWYWAPAYLLGAAAIAGLIWAVVVHTKGSIAALGMYILAAGLFVLVSASPWLGIRDFYTGPWYNNIPRVAALLTIVIVPFAAAGLAAAWNGVARLFGRPGETAPLLRGTVAVVAAAATLALLQVSVMPKVISQASWVYRVTDDSPLVSTDELALLGRLSEHVPEGARIAGSPWTGTALAYALENRDVLVPHTAITFDADAQTIIDELNSAHLNASEVCPALADYDVEYILDFGDLEVHGDDNSWRFPGFAELEASQAVELIDQEGEDAKLYRIVACPLGAR